jgi:hypothetical protein
MASRYESNDTYQKVTIDYNYVHGYYADHLGQNGGPEVSQPVCGIGGYGDGKCDYVICSYNDVVPYNGHNAYQFFNFDRGHDPGVGGEGNTGTPVSYDNNPTDTPPVGMFV